MLIKELGPKQVHCVFVFRKVSMFFVADSTALTEGAVTQFLRENPNPDLGEQGARLSASSNMVMDVNEVMPTSTQVDLAHIRLSHPGRGQGLRQLSALVSSHCSPFQLSALSQVCDALGNASPTKPKVPTPKPSPHKAAAKSAANL
jgi:hypothetical protein